MWLEEHEQEREVELKGVTSLNASCEAFTLVQWNSLERSDLIFAYKVQVYVEDPL